MEFDTVEEYQTVVQCSADLIAVADENGVFLHYSPSVTRILGYEPDDLLGNSAFSYIHPHDRAEVYTLYREMVEDPEIVTQRAEFRFRTADDDWVWLEAHGSNRTESPIDGYVINAREITERKELERELQREKQQVQQFVSIIAHDLRNPLTIAKEYLDTARSNGAPSLLDVVDEELERMERIVANTLSTTQVDLVDQETGFVSLAAVTESVWEDLPTELAELTIARDLQIRADEQQLRLLFENLFRNSLEHASTRRVRPGDGSEGGQIVHVEVGSLTGPSTDDRDDGDVSGFYVTDDGPGIPKNRRENVFEAGYTTDPEKTGLGLAIVRAVAIAHRWTCVVAESDREGARFEFTGIETA
ncbi:PAS domain-containing sensor histidine kinase [Halobacteria archaeon AArc-m2/3/4]|uniref:histidine kinase n=1 Tax=Natronoglomus mannanivorans TaxID=2979990 RepID=A0ABT2QE07_9EURY|nr:PAS domain-containing sensor histidine kinase [Halobacteria archaeon AArc-m2/3/4]